MLAISLTGIVTATPYVGSTEALPAQIPAFAYALCGPASLTATQALYQIYSIGSCHTVGIRGAVCMPVVVLGTGNANTEHLLWHFVKLNCELHLHQLSTKNQHSVEVQELAEALLCALGNSCSSQSFFFFFFFTVVMMRMGVWDNSCATAASDVVLPAERSSAALCVEQAPLHPLPPQLRG